MTEDERLTERLGAAEFGQLDRLRADLVDRVTREGLVDVAYRVMDTAVGSLLLAATPIGVVRVAFDRQDHESVLAGLAKRISPRVLHAPARLDPVARQIEEYLDAGRVTFDLPVDLALARGFRRIVLEHLRQVPYGATASYTDLATASGRPRASRATGTACATNPLPLVIPCHRIVRSDGSLGSYVGGAEVKAALLALEGAVTA